MSRNIKIFLILLLISGIIGVEAKIVDNTNKTPEPATLGWPPWDSISQIQSTNTKNVYMKIDYIPITEWVDIEGYFNQLNFFQYPISLKLVNGTNVAIKNQNIYVWIDEYNMWWNYWCGCWDYDYITTYSNQKKTGSSGTVDFLFSIPYKGYDKNFYRMTISYYNSSSGDYAYYGKNTRVSWYINTASPFDPSRLENLEYRKNMTLGHRRNITQK